MFSTAKKSCQAKYSDFFNSYYWNFVQIPFISPLSREPECPFPVKYGLMDRPQRDHFERSKVLQDL